MNKLAVLAWLCVAACGNKHEAKPSTTSAQPVAPAKTDEPAAKTAAPATRLALGDATVFELVDRRYHNRDKPARDVVLHADGTAEMINDKTDKPMFTLVVKPDGKVTAPDGKTFASIDEHAITNVMTNKPIAALDGDTLSLEVNDKTVKVALAADGSVTVLDNPYGTKWRIEAKDPAVMRTAFLVLALQMEAALD